MQRKVLNGILCAHTYPLEDFEESEAVLYLHNEPRPLALIVRDFAEWGEVGVSYFLSESRKTEGELTLDALNRVCGDPSICVESDGRPFSDVTPDLCWTHHNRFLIGGHDMNRELERGLGKWVLLVLTAAAKKEGE